MTREVLRLGILLVALRAAHGGPPLLTDDPFTPSLGRWEINLASATEHEGREWLWEAPILDINYGWGERVQLKAEAPYVFRDGPDSSRSGLGNAALGVKWRFFDSEDEGCFVSIYPQWEFELSRSATRHGLADGGHAFLLPFQLAHTRGPVTLYAEAGWQWRETGDEAWIFGCAAECELSESVALMSEVHAEIEGGAGNGTYVFNVGTAIALVEGASLIVSAGRSLRASPRAGPDFLAYFGVQLTF